MAEKTEKKNKIEFEVEKDGKKVAVVVLRPTRKDEQDAEMEYNRVYTQLFRNKGILKAEVDRVARERDLWSDAKENESKELVEFLQEGQRIVTGNVPGITKAEARKTAIEMRKKRMQLFGLNNSLSDLRNKTAEHAADTAKFNFKMARCTKYAETNKVVWGSVDAMLEGAEDDPIYSKAFEAAFELEANIDNKWQHKLPENKFLLDHGFCNADLRLIDAVTGKLVDEDGKFINDRGQFINEKNEPVNEKGDLVDENGNLIQGPYEFKD